MKLDGLPDYERLDASGEAEFAAVRMEARAREPASEALFRTLVAPYVDELAGRGSTARVLELGCGTGAMARRLALRAPHAQVIATDKSEGMLAFAARLLDDSTPRVVLCRWDATQQTGPAEVATGSFDLVLGAVVLPYLSDPEVDGVVTRLATQLKPGGVMLFVEQDLMTDSLESEDRALTARVLDRSPRAWKRTLGLGVRPVLRAAGLDIEPVRSFLWTERRYGPYLRDLLPQTATDALARGRITSKERESWIADLERKAATDDFQYGLVYHAIAARKPARRQ